MNTSNSLPPDLSAVQSRNGLLPEHSEKSLSPVLPADLVAVQADDALLDALLDALGAEPALAGPDVALNRVLVMWCLDMHAEPIPALVDVDTALVLVGASRRSLVSRALRWVRRLVSDRPV